MDKDSTQLPCHKDNDTRLNLLLGVSGSVATIVIADLVKSIEATQHFNIKIIVTEKAQQFINSNIEEELKNVQVYSDKDEWGKWSKKGDPVMHIDLRKWADILLIAPLSANTLAKISNGLCDNLLTCVARAWDFSIAEEKLLKIFDYSPQQLLMKPFIVAPAMNTLMYNHPFTAKQLKKLQKLHVTVLHTQEKVLVCGDKGLGAMMSIDNLTQVLEEARAALLGQQTCLV